MSLSTVRVNVSLHWTPLHAPPRQASGHTLTFCWSLADLYVSVYSASHKFMLG